MVDVPDMRLRVGKYEQEQSRSLTVKGFAFLARRTTDDRCEGQGRDLLRPVAPACPCRCKIPIYRPTANNGPVAPALPRLWK
jgi:hypothetical protein